MTTPEQSELLTKSYEMYEHLIAQYGQLSPQKQGLLPHEYAEALVNPDVITTKLETESGECEVPQLSPVEQYSWLNADFYQRKFPAESDSNRLRHFTDIPGLVPSAEVVAGLKELAAKEGVLVFDYPLEDPAYPVRVLGHLHAAGIEIDAGTIEELGKQTYFIGRTTLKRREVGVNPRGDLKDGFDAMVAEGDYDQARYENGASLRRSIDESQAEVMYGFYDEAFKVLSDHPCEQGLSPEDFKKMMTQKDHVAKIVNAVEGEVVSLVLLDSRLDELSWLNAEYYRQHFGEEIDKGQLVYFPALAANPNHQGGLNTQVMVDLIAQAAEKANNNISIAFDCCDMNTGFLDVFLDTMINQTKEAGVEIKPFAVQRYCAVRLKVGDS